MRGREKALFALIWSSAAMVGIAIYLVFLVAPMERTMGTVQRIFYFHVGSGWVGAAAFLAALVAGVCVLRTGKRQWDRFAVSAIEVGFVFITMIVVTGSIWAKSAWNTWWTWSPRLTSAAVMWLVYVAYFMLRSAIDDPGKQARFSAVYAIVGFIPVVGTFLSIRMLKDIHPTLFGSGAAETGGGLADGMHLPFFFSLATFSVLGITLLLHRIWLARLEDEITDLRTRLLIRSK